MEMGIIGFAVWSMAALIFVGIGISSRKSVEPVGFFSNVKPPKEKDVKQYNKAVSTIWIVFAVVFEILGIPILVFEQNSPVFLVVVLGVVVLLIGIIIAYFKVEAKYRE